MPFPKSNRNQDAVPVKIDVGSNRSKHEWAGFGSTAFSISEPELTERPGRANGEVPSAPIVRDLMNMSYGECGLTRARVNPFRYEPDYKGPYKPAKTWTSEDFKLRGIDRVLDYLFPAREAGLAEILATVSGRELHDSMLEPNKRSLRAEAHEEYVQRAIALIKHWRDTYGIEVRAWSLFNEPNFPVEEPSILGVEGHVDLTKRLGRAFVREGLSTRIFAADDWSIRHCALKISQAILADAEARQYVSAVGYHSYDGYDFAQQDWRDFSEERAARETLAALCEEYHVPVWMTEVSNYRPANDEWHNVVFRMCQIHDDLVHGRVCAWDFMLAWWQGAWRKNKRGGPQGLAEFYYEPDGSIRRTQLTGTATAVGHWSRVVRPGWKQMAVKCGNSNVRPSAFVSPDDKRLAVVIIQDASSGADISISLPEANQWKPAANGFYSNSVERWGDIGPVLGRSGVFSLPLPMQCTCTLVFEAI